MSAYYNDNEHFCAQVLRMNIQRGLLPEGFVDERSITEIHASDFMGHNHIHLFAGIGGFPLGLQWAGIPSHLRILTGGFPCQDISNAGKRAGITGERSGLWKEQYRLICEAADCGMGFDYIFVENVAPLVNRGLSTVLADLADLGYDAEWRVLRASDVGAPHERKRIFIVAYPNGEGRQTSWTWQQATASLQCSQNIFYLLDTWLAQSRMGRDVYGVSVQLDQHRWPAGQGYEQYAYEPVRTTSERIPSRANRLKALGNGIVPQLVTLIGRAIVEHEMDRGVA